MSKLLLAWLSVLGDVNSDDEILVRAVVLTVGETLLSSLGCSA